MFHEKKKLQILVFKDLSFEQGNWTSKMEYFTDQTDSESVSNPDEGKRTVKVSFKTPTPYFWSWEFTRQYKNTTKQEEVKQITATQSCLGNGVLQLVQIGKLY